MSSLSSPGFSIGANEFSTPRIGDLARTVTAITPDAPVPQLLELFHRQETVLAVPLTDPEERYLGLVSRRTFMSFMSRAYTREIYTRRPIADLLKAMPELATAPVQPAPDARVDQVLMEYLACDPGMLYDALPVLAGERIVGIVAIADLMLSLSESQGKLLAAIQSLSERLKREVALAAQVQKQLLPPPETELPGVKGLATLLTSSEVGGDYYDCYSVDGRYAVLMVGDVSGHGVAAGTLVSAVHASVKLLAAAGERDPARILQRLNATLLDAAHQTLYMTFFVACLDTLTGRLAYANAGHPFPYLYRTMLGTLEMLEAGGLPLGKAESVDYAVASTELDLGDRLFLYTDGIVEEASRDGQPFGYERLEDLLGVHGGDPFEPLRDRLLEVLAEFSGRPFFEDDITFFALEYHERPLHGAEPAPDLPDFGEPSLVRLLDSWYRANDQPISPYISRQTLVFLAEGEFSDLLPRFSRDGIRRALPRHQPFLQRLGWDTLINQHHSHAAGDLSGLLAGAALWRDFRLTHSDDKSFVIAETGALLEEAGVGAEHLEAALLAVDELLENGLYAAPQNGRGAPLHPKGERRGLAQDESLSLYVGLKGDTLGLSVVDSWGTLTPAVFLDRLARHAEGEGLIAGQGGAGFYLLWRLSDYLQLRVLPHRQTQITVLFDLSRPLTTDADPGFQFLFHSEVHEITHHAPCHALHSAGTLA